MLWLSLMKWKTRRIVSKCILWKSIWLNGCSQKSRFQYLKLYQIASYKELFYDQWYHRENGSGPFGYFDQPENFYPNEFAPSVLTGKLGVAEYNVVSGTLNSVFMTEFDFVFYGLSFYVGWTSSLSSLHNFQLYLWIDECTLAFWTIILITI